MSTTTTWGTGIIGDRFAWVLDRKCNLDFYGFGAQARIIRVLRVYWGLLDFIVFPPDGWMFCQPCLVGWGMHNVTYIQLATPPYILDPILAPVLHTRKRQQPLTGGPAHLPSPAHLGHPKINGPSCQGRPSGQ